MFVSFKHSPEKSDCYSPNFNVVDFAFGFCSKKNVKTTIILLYAIVALTAWKYIPAAPLFADPQTSVCVLDRSFDSNVAIKPLDGNLSVSPYSWAFLWNSRKLWSAFILMGLFPTLIVKFAFKDKLADYGLTFGRARRTLVCFLLLFPIMILLGWASGYTKEFYNVYPFNPLAGSSWNNLWIHSIMYFFLYYLAWEFMFRGFIQLGLTETLGFVPAVLIQVVASTMLHYGHPISETYGCIAGGLLWGFLVYRTRSIVAGMCQHALLGIALDWSLILNAT